MGGSQPFLSALLRPRVGVRGGLVAAMVLLALATLAPDGPAQAQQLPAIPGLTVTVASSTSLKVTWNAVASSQVYFVDWKSGAQAYSTTERTASVSFQQALSYTIPGLTTGESYTVRVQAIGSGGTVLALSEVIATPGTPEIDVQGNAASIPDGDTTPRTADHTDFGSAVWMGGKVTRTFTIRNTGTGSLSLTGNPKVAVSGTNAGDFRVTAQPSSPVAATTGTTTFKVEFDPSGTGARTAKLSIANDDSNENPYDFDIKGTGTQASSATEVFSTTMTVGVGTSFANTGFSSVFGSLDSTSFTYKGWGFRLDDLYVHFNGNLIVDFNVSSVVGSLTYAAAYSLCLDGTKHVGWTGDFTTSYSAASSLSWTDGQRVAVRLVKGTTCGSTTTTEPLKPAPGATHPAVPDVKVSATGRTSIRVTWGVVGQENSGRWAGTGQYTARSYDLYYKSGIEGYSGQRKARVHHARRNDRASAPYADLDNLTHGRTYTVRVRASQFALQYDAQGKLTGVAQEVLALSEATFRMDGERGVVLYPKSATPRPNTAPAFTDAPAAQTATEGAAFAYTLPEAKDNEGNAVVYAAALADGGDLPEWLAFDPAARTFSGTPGADDTGTLNIAVTATDDGAPPLSATGAFRLTVREADAPPAARRIRSPGAGASWARRTRSSGRGRRGSPMRTRRPQPGACRGARA